MKLSREAKLVSGITLLGIPLIMLGGISLLAVLTREAAGTVIIPLEPGGTEWALGRAGHAHAGVWAILAVLLQLLIDAARLSRPVMWLARLGAPLGAAALSSGLLGLAFFPASRWLLYFGALSMAVSLLLTGAGLLRSLGGDFRAAGPG